MEIAMYGRVGILRDFCQKCGYTALVLDGRMACCDTPIRMNQAITSLKREAVTFDVRRLNKYQREFILDNQGNRCFYCNKLFGSNCYHNGKLIKLAKQFDHIIPMAYQSDSSLPNIVAACRQCNAWKSSKIFSSIEEARAFLSEKWEKHRDAPKIRRRVKVVSYGVEL
jgi:hypothetical protein